jgi:hypothetical protein
MQDHEVTELIMAAVDSTPPRQHKCLYCGQAFARESTLAAHQCEPKRRHQQRGEMGVQLGFQAWLRFYELTQGSARSKTYEDFSASQFYSAFTKFGRHCHSISAIDAGRFIDYVIKGNFKLDHWCRDEIYAKYLFELLRTEAAQDALERSIKTMVEWGDLKSRPFNDYFREISAGRLADHLRNGRISPWVIYCSDSGIARLESLSEDLLSLIITWIDPPYWIKRLHDYPADAELSRLVLSEAGL